MNRRPLSPHLQIYRPQLTSVLSITHRITGVLLFKGLLWGIIALGIVAYDASSLLAFLQTSPYSCLVKITIWLMVWSASYHWINGLRHLLWDMGWFLDIKSVYSTGWTALVISIVSTLFFYWAWMQ